jgi:hypothetical protein
MYKEVSFSYHDWRVETYHPGPLEHLSEVLLSNLHFLRFLSSIQILSYHPSDEGALANYAVLCTAKGEYTTAESLYRSALMSQPRHLVLMTNYAHLLHHQVTPPREFAVEGFVFRVEGSR